jgi:tetratricopeptide (TPR) repeat protein
MESPSEKYWKHSQVLLGQNRFDLAEQSLRKALEADPIHPLAPAALAWAMFRQYHTQEALDQAREAVRLRPEYGFAHYVAALAAGSREDFDGALAYAKEAVRLRPEIVRYHRILPGIHLVRDEFEQVVETAGRALQLQADDPVLQRMRAIGLAGLGRAEEAKTMVAEFLCCAPADPNAHLCAGHVYRLLREYADSEAAYRQSLALNPNLASGHGGLGLIRYQQELLADAKPFLEQATRLHDGDPEVRRALAAIRAAEQNCAT